MNATKNPLAKRGTTVTRNRFAISTPVISPRRSIAAAQGRSVGRKAFSELRRMSPGKR